MVKNKADDTDTLDKELEEFGDMDQEKVGTPKVLSDTALAGGPSIKEVEADLAKNLEDMAQLENEPSDAEQATTVMSEEERIKNAIISHNFFILGKQVYGDGLMAIAAKDGKARIMLGYNLLPNAQALQITGKEELTDRVKSTLKEIQEYLLKGNRELLPTPYDKDKVRFSFGYAVEYARDDSLEKSISGIIKEACSINKHIKRKILPEYFNPPISLKNRLSLTAKRALSYIKLSSYPELFLNLSGPDVYNMQKDFYRQRHRAKATK